MIYVFDSSVARYLGVLGIVLWPFVFIALPKEDTSPNLMKHELTHVHQIRREGVLRFYAQYVYCLCSHYYEHRRWEGGFVDNRWEKEAYANEVNAVNAEECAECQWNGPTNNKAWKMLRTKKAKSRKGCHKVD